MKRLNYLIKDEKKAPIDYRKLLKNLKYKSDKKIVKGIIRDERRHGKLLRKIRRRY